ncbi:MAG: helix-turn-helix transcriptional regulator [Acidobacteriota bacterium]
MQAISINRFPVPYDDGMQRGRPSKQPRTPFGERLYAARTAVGLSQAQVAEKLGITQTAYADWERYPVALRPDQIEKLTEIVKVSVEHLYGNGHDRRQGGGPIGKARRAFEGVSRLPKRQQQKIVEVVEAFVAQHAVAQ